MGALIERYGFDKRGCVLPLADDTFPEEEFASVAHVLVPLIPLDTQAGNVRARLQTCKVQYAQQYPQATILPTAITAGQHPNGLRWRARPDQIDTFLNACADLEWAQVNFLMWEDLYAQPMLWRAVQGWEYTPPQQIPAPQAIVQTPNTPTAPAVAGVAGTGSGVASNLRPRDTLLQYGVALGSDMGVLGRMRKKLLTCWKWCKPWRSRSCLYMLALTLQ